MFVATYFSTISFGESWLVDSGCTNHMTNDEELFQELSKSTTTKVRIGNGECIEVKGKGTVSIETYSGTKLIPDVYYIPDINQNL